MLADQIKKITVIGAGQIGPDIALHFSKTLSPKGVSVIVIDISPEALEKAQAKAFRKIQKGLESGAFKAAQAETMKSAMVFTGDYSLAAGSQIIVEAATEDENIKDRIFRQLEPIAGKECVFLSNSSHMQPEIIFRNIGDKSRCLVAHYFFPAEMNPVVEIVPGPETAPGLAGQLLRFYESIGKVPIEVGSSYGYAIDPIFEGLCQTAILCLEKGWGNEKEIDAAAVKALGLGVGPFTALNLTGGNPITAHGLDETGKRVHPWFKTPALLHRKNESKEAWATAKRDEQTVLSKEKEEMLVKEFRGAYFTLASLVLDLGIVAPDDLNMACELALVIHAPLRFMNETGIANAYSLASDFCRAHDIKIPSSLENAVKQGGWSLRDIVTARKNNVLIITIRRPKVLNALNLDVLKQIRAAMEAERESPGLKAVVITGFGTKAFVSGADINMLASLRSPEEGYENSQTFQSVLNYIEAYPLPVICAMNGFAFGGGNELAMSCTARISKKGLPVLACQPEVNLGFIPGAGGTQRLPRIVGLEKASEILRTGRSVSGKEALEIGLVNREAQGDLVDEAVRFALEIADGSAQIKKLPAGPVAAVGKPGQIDLGHLSKKIDSILVRAIYEGSQMNLSEGLDLESKMFAECMKTEDMKIGLSNFKTNGPKAQANFIHS